MKKLIVAIATVGVAAVVNAATVGWNIATGSTAYANDAYQFFVIGQNGADSIATVTALLDAGTSAEAYAFGTGSVAANGTGIVTAAASGKTLGAGDYTSFFVLYDSATPTAGTSKYIVVSGASTLEKTIGGSTAQVVFASGSVASTLGTASNWKSFGTSSVPEPTSGLLMLLGMAGLALRRRRA